MSADTTRADVSEHDLLTVLKYLAGGRDIEFAAQATQLPEATVALIADDHGFPDLATLRWAADLQQKSIDKAHQAYAPASPRPLAERVMPPNPTRAPAPRPPAPAAARPLPTPILSAVAAAKPTADTPPIDPVAALLGDLVSQGLKSGKTRTRAVAQKILDTAKDLQRRLDADVEDQAQLEAESKARAAADAEIRLLEKKLMAAKAKRNAVGSKKKSSGADTGALKARHDYQKQTLAIYGVTVEDIRQWAVLSGHKVGAVGMLPRAILDAFAHDKEAEARSGS